MPPCYSEKDMSKAIELFHLFLWSLKIIFHNLGGETFLTRLPTEKQSYSLNAAPTTIHVPGCSTLP